MPQTFEHDDSSTLLPAERADVPELSNPTLRDTLLPFLANGQLAGAVTLVADKDRIASHDAVGFSDLSAGKPMQLDSMFWIASQTKPMTACLLMMLVDEGKVGLTDPVKKFLPEFESMWVIDSASDTSRHLVRADREITLRDVLCHCSGLAFCSPMEHPTFDLLRLRDSVRSNAMLPLQSQPGSRYLYSNAGTNIVGRVVEVVSGMAYENFLQQRLLDPLGMTDTTFWPTPEQINRLAKTYRPNSAGTDLEETQIDQLRYPLSDVSRYAMPAGGLFATAVDVSRFCQMMLNDGVFGGVRLLSAYSVDQMRTRQTPASVQESYGLCFSIEGSRFGHAGALATTMTIYRDKGLITVYLAQHAGFLGDGAATQSVFSAAAMEKFAGR